MASGHSSGAGSVCPLASAEASAGEGDSQATRLRRPPLRRPGLCAPAPSLTWCLTPSSTDSMLHCISTTCGRGDRGSLEEGTPRAGSLSGPQDTAARERKHSFLSTTKAFLRRPLPLPPDAEACTSTQPYLAGLHLSRLRSWSLDRGGHHR